MEKKNELAKRKSEITDQVLSRLREFQDNGLKLPKDFSPENALKAAYLVLSEKETADKKPVLEACTTSSIGNALLNMVVDGTNPMKNQCSFIAYANELQYDRTYFGDEMMFKRDAGGKSVVPVAIHAKDKFSFKVDFSTGIKEVTQHEQTLESLNSPVVGAYCYLTWNDGTKYLEIMTIDQIEAAWAQRKGNPKSPAHKNFPDEMAKKTVVRRACKPYLNSLSDANLVWDEKQNMIKDKTKESLESERNETEQQTIEFEDAEVVEETETIDGKINIKGSVENVQPEIEEEPF